jgi:hypothetical protein
MRDFWMFLLTATCDHAMTQECPDIGIIKLGSNQVRRANHIAVRFEYLYDTI